VSTISSSLLSQIAGSPTAANQFATDLNQLAKDLQSGNLPAAQQDWVTLSQDAQNGVTSSTATTSASGITTSALSDITASSTAASAFANELNLLGADLGNGDLSSAKNDLQTLDATAQSAVTSASAVSSPVTPATPAEIAELIQAVVAALGAGDNAAAGSVLSELASVSPSSKGAAVLQQQSESLSSASASSSSSSPLSSLLQGLNSSGSGSSALSLLA